MRGQFRGLKGDGHVAIGNRPTLLAHPAIHFLKQQDAGNPLIGRVAVREEMPDVAQCQRTEQGIAQCVNRHIAIGVRHKSPFRRNLHPTQIHRKPIGYPVNIISLANSKFYHILSFLQNYTIFY